MEEKTKRSRARLREIKKRSRKMLQTQREIPQIEKIIKRIRRGWWEKWKKGQRRQQVHRGDQKTNPLDNCFVERKQRIGDQNEWNRIQAREPELKEWVFQNRVRGQIVVERLGIVEKHSWIEQKNQRIVGIHMEIKTREGKSEGVNVEITRCACRKDLWRRGIVENGRKIESPG